MVKKEAKWMDLKKKAPELALSIFEDADEVGNGNAINIHMQILPNVEKWCVITAEPNKDTLG
jgi:hypothetical protein